MIAATIELVRGPFDGMQLSWPNEYPLSILMPWDKNFQISAVLLGGPLAQALSTARYERSPTTRDGRRLYVFRR